MKTWSVFLVGCAVPVEVEAEKVEMVVNLYFYVAGEKVAVFVEDQFQGYRLKAKS